VFEYLRLTNCFTQIRSVLLFSTGTEEK